MDKNAKNSFESVDFFDVLANKIADQVALRLGDSAEKPAMLSVKSMARILDCSTSEVRKYLQQNSIPSVRFGHRGYRVAREVFEAHLERWKKGGSLWDTQLWGSLHSEVFQRNIGCLLCYENN
jgi:excisionase family DNA binding protein